MKPNLYLDIDGVMLLFPASENHEETINEWLLDFIVNNRDRFNIIYWLSCWTFNANLDEVSKQHPELLKIGAIPLFWHHNKTDAIDWSRPFIWMEDGLTTEERKIFNERAKFGQQVWEIRNKWR